jgi:hypothetical protein
MIRKSSANRGQCRRRRADRNVGLDYIRVGPGSDSPVAPDRKTAFFGTISIQKKRVCKIQTWMNLCKRYICNNKKYGTIRKNVDGMVILLAVVKVHSIVSILLL